jgi:hypothetical protein
MRRAALFLAACVAVVSAAGSYAQQADLIASTNNPPEVSQSVPRLIMFTGTVMDLTGKPLTGPVELNFAIYKEQTDAAPLWQESQTLNLDEQGHYTALLGAMQPDGLPVELFTTGEARWLGVAAGKMPEQARVLLVSVPYALKANDAELLGGKPASAYALAQPAGTSTSAGTATAGTTVPGGAATSELAAPGKPKSGPKPNVAGTGTQNYIPVWTNNTGTLANSVIYQSGSNVGIGTTTPGYRLDVVGGSARVTNPSGTTQVQVSGSATSGRLGQDANGFFFSSDTSGAALRFATNNGTLNEWMRITSAGLVGIGTTKPASALHVVGTTGLTWTNGGTGNLGLVTLGTPGTGGSLYVNTPSATSTYPSGLGIDGTYGTPSLQSVINIRALGVHSGGAYGSQLAFWTTSGAALNQQMTITSAGKVGIGTTTPAATLEVNGTAKFDGAVTFASADTFSGNLKITGAGNAIIFPDGTVQSTAGTGSGGGTITGVTAGTGLTGGGATGNVTLSLAPSSCTAASALTGLPLTCQPFATLGANTFSADQNLNAALNLAQTTGPDVGVINLGGNPLIHACCPNSAQNTFLGASAGNFTADATGSDSGNGSNTATGVRALQALTSGYYNTADGAGALYNETVGSENTADGVNALFGNTTGNRNSANGSFALLSNTTGSSNVALGGHAGDHLVSGNSNIMLGVYAGTLFTSNESNNIEIGNNGVAAESGVIRVGTAGTQTQTYIAGITGVTPGGASPLPVIIDGNGQLGTGTSAVGTVTSVASGTGLTGGPITTSGTLSLDTTFTDGRYAQLGAANTFTGNETLNGTLSASSASGTPVSGNSTAASGATFGVSGSTNSTTSGAAGVSGTANGATGQTFGVNGTTNSTSNGAAGVQGGASASTGQTAGVSGYTNSTSNFASGVSGGANANTGQTYGVQGGTISSTNGAAGVFGNAGASTGKTYGVAGSTSSTTNGAAGVNGNANGATGATYGVSGFTNSTSNGAAGVEGGANGASGQTTGVFGYTNSTTDFSYGVQGNANGASGQTTGVFGTTNSTANNAGGVSGYASATTGQTYGTSGTTNSTTIGAAGVAGFANASTGQAFGVIGNTNSTTDGAVGVQGTASGATGSTVGVSGSTNSTSFNATGVRGSANATTGEVFGVEGSTNSTTNFSAGVEGGAGASSGVTSGVVGYTKSTTDGAAGVSGNAMGATGAISGVSGTSASSSGYGVFGNGVTGVYGQSTTSGGSGVYGAAGSGTYAGYFNGNVTVTGSVTAGSFTGAGIGTVTSVASGAGLTGGPITTSGTLSIATGAVTNAMLQNSSLAVNAGSGLTGGGSVSLGGNTSLNLNPNINGMASAFSDNNTSQVVSVTQSGSGMALVGTDSAYGSYGQLGTSVVVPSVGTFGTGVYGYGGTTNSTTYGVYGNGYDGVYGNGSYLGLLGYGGSYGLWATGGFAGVYGHSSNYAGVEGDNDGSATYGVLSVGPFAATGTKSAIVPLADDRVVSLYAMESPENWFEDFGTAELHNGVAEVTLDPTFEETVSTEAGYHVFLTPDGDCEGLFVATKTFSGFEVRELRGGKSDISFDYRIVARRKGYEKLRLQQVEADPETVQALRAQTQSLSTSKLPKLIIHKALPGPPKVGGPEPVPPGVVIPKPPERPEATAMPPALLGQFSVKE